MITRFGGGGGDMIGVGDNDSVNAEAFAYMVVFGYQYILIVQLIGIVLGEGLNVQNLIYTSLGCIFYLSLGAAQISKTRNLKEYEDFDDKVSNRLLMGSMCIITSFIFLADAILIAMMEKKKRSS